MTYSRCVMILADGARPDVFEALLRAGELPHIARYIVEPGCYRQGVTSFPSTTGPAYMPFLTGCLPGTCNVPGIRWMDKAQYRSGGLRGLRSYCSLSSYKINADITPTVQTVFDLLPRSYNIFSAVHRGIHWRHNLTRIIRLWYWYYAHLTDRWAFIDDVAREKLTRVMAEDFQFCFAVMIGIDEYSHLDDPLGATARARYHALDNAVGAAAQRLQRNGRLEETLWWIVSDHGLSATTQHFCVNTFLAQHAERPLYFPSVQRRGCTVANMMSGNSMTHLYFRHRDGWAAPVDYEYLQETTGAMFADLLEEPAVDLVIARAHDGRVVVRRRTEEARLTERGEHIHYQALRGDPLRVGAPDVLLRREECLQQLADSRYPDGPYQVSHLFKSARTGDVLVTARPGYDLRLGHEEPEHRGSHGSLHRDHMRVPVLCSHPLQDTPLRTVDVFPTMLHLLGRSVPPGIDGVVRV